MEYCLLNQAIAKIKELEDKEAFEEALTNYESLLAQNPDKEQRLVIEAGKATTLLRMKEPKVALALLAQVSLDEFSPSQSAVVYNVRASALYDCERYNDALADATKARQLAESAVEVDPEIVGEAIAQQGFALASLGQLKQAIECFDLAETMSLPGDIQASIPLFRNYCYERAIAELPSLHERTRPS